MKKKKIHNIYSNFNDLPIRIVEQSIFEEKIKEILSKSSEVLDFIFKEILNDKEKIEVFTLLEIVTYEFEKIILQSSKYQHKITKIPPMRFNP